MNYLGLFLAGALLCNAIPHLVSGLRGETFHTPWARPRGVGHSSALQNFLWGAANLLAGIWLIDREIGNQIAHGRLVIVAGFVLAGIGLSIIFGRRRAKS